jgi:hypothetical protein
MTTRPRPGGQRRRAGRRADRRLAVEQLEDPGARRGRALGQAEREAERAHRPEQHEQQHVEGGEVAERQLAVDHPAPAEQQDRGEPELGEEGDERRVERPDARRDHRLVEDAGHRAGEPLTLALLACERLDDAYAGDVLLGLGGQLGDALLDLLQRRARPASEPRGGQHHERHGDERDRREDGIDEEHRRGGEEDRQRRLEDEDEAVAEEEADRLQVDGGARHELTGLLAVEEPELERLQVPVEAWRRSTSMPSDTLPATSRRTTVSARRRTPATATAIPSISRSARSFWRT